MDQRERDEQARAATEAAERLAGQGVVGVGVTWVDNSGVTRVKAVPLSRLAAAAAWGIGVSPVFDAFLSDDSVVAGRYAGGPVGDLRLHPDLARLTVLAEQPGWAWAPADRYRQDGTPHPQDQRTLARRAVAELAAAGLAAKVAFEVEWAVGDDASGRDFVPAALGPAYGYARLSERSDYLHDLLVALDAQGVAVDQIHPEYAAGQFEVSVAAEEPLAAADTFVLVRETIRAVTTRHGMRASFSPKVLADGVGNGGHVHLSVWRGGTNLFAGGDNAHGLTGDAVAFTAGILSRLPALLAVGAPSAASYLRLVPHHWAGAFQAWGLENRETALRVVTGSAGCEATAANLEVKAFDEAANPYLVVAGLLFSGLAGLRGGESLPPPVDVDPGSLSDDERRTRGIPALPSTLGAVADAFEADPVLSQAFGTELAATIVDVRRAEAALFADASAEDVAAAVRWTY